LLPTGCITFMRETKLPRSISTLCLKCDGTRAKTKFRLSAKRTSPFKSARASVHLTTDSRGVLISDSNAGYTMFRGSVKSTGYHSPVSPSLPLPRVTVCHHISTGLYKSTWFKEKTQYIFPPRSRMGQPHHSRHTQQFSRALYSYINRLPMFEYEPGTYEQSYIRFHFRWSLLWVDPEESLHAVCNHLIQHLRLI